MKCKCTIEDASKIHVRMYICRVCMVHRYVCMELQTYVHNICIYICTYIHLIDLGHDPPRRLVGSTVDCQTVPVAMVTALFVA